MSTIAKGFTLIELLVVMAILGILAVVVLIAINPAQQLARTRDTGRISTVTQLGRDVMAYYTDKGEMFPDETTWIDDLVSEGQISSIPSGIAYTLEGTSGCTTNAIPSTESTFCYKLDSVNNYGALIFANLESQTYKERCNLIGNTYAVFSTADGKGGIICSATDPEPWEAGTGNYLE